MAKVNFTKTHFDRMSELLLKMLISNDTIKNSLGTPVEVSELLHGTTIKSLIVIKSNLGKKISNLEEKDEWASDEKTQAELEKAKESKELVNLIIGYKRHLDEVASIAKKREELQNQLDELKESQKTPEDRIKELEESLKKLDATEDF